MSESLVHVICFCNGQMLRTNINTKYVGDKVVIMPLDVHVSSTFEHLLTIDIFEDWHWQKTFSISPQ